MILHGASGPPETLSALRDRTNHTGGRWDNAGRCVCASGAALAAPKGRAGRLLGLTANEERISCGGAENPKNPTPDPLQLLPCGSFLVRREVKQARRATSRGRVSGA